MFNKDLLKLLLILLWSIFMLPILCHAGNIYVNSINDNLNPGDNTCTLREAITIANQNSISNYIECMVSGTLGDDTILFTSNLANQTIVIYSVLPTIVSESTGGKLTIDGEGKNITISGNDQRRVFNISQNANISFKNLTISHGRYGSGGGLYVDINAIVQILNVKFTNNTGYYGIAIYNKGNLLISDSEFTDNKGISEDASVIYNDKGNITIHNSNFHNHNKLGTVIYNKGYIGDNIITNCTFIKNNGTGIIHYSGILLVSQSFFSENKKSAIKNYSKLTIEQSTFSKNEGSGGGAIYSYSRELIIKNSTFWENYAEDKGGAIWATYDINTSPPRHLDLSFVTIVGNRAGNSGAGIYADNSINVIIKNSIIANNKLNNGTNQNCNAVIISALGKNFSTDTSCGSGFEVVDYGQLKLGLLQNNTGPTPTVALKPGSVAINSVTDCTDVNNNPVTIDQRGVKRPYGTYCDSGSYEYNPYKIVFRITKPNGGERWNAGQSYTIKWEAPKSMVKFILEYSNDNKTTWNPIAIVNNNTIYNSYTWRVPAQDGRKTKCYLRIKGYNSKNIFLGYDLSDGSFIIEVLKLTQPNGGETLTAGQLYQIKWETYALTKTVSEVQLHYTTNGGLSWSPIVNLIGNPGNYTWEVPNANSTNCRVRVILKDSNGTEIVRDVSDRAFTIKP